MKTLPLLVFTFKWMCGSLNVNGKCRRGFWKCENFSPSTSCRTHDLVVCAYWFLCLPSGFTPSGNELQREFCRCNYGEEFEIWRGCLNWSAFDEVKNIFQQKCFFFIKERNNWKNLLNIQFIMSKTQNNPEISNKKFLNLFTDFSL